MESYNSWVQVVLRSLHMSHSLGPLSHMESQLTESEVLEKREQRLAEKERSWKNEDVTDKHDMDKVFICVTHQRSCQFRVQHW